MASWLHPTLVHFAVALLFTGLLCDVLGLARSSERLLFAGFWNTIFGAGAAVAAVLSGLWAESVLPPMSPLGDPLLQFHKIFAFGGTAVALVLAGGRLFMKGYIRPKTRTIYLAGAFLGAGLLVITGALGGTIVYGYGVGIPPETAARILDAQPRPPTAPPRPAPPPALDPADTPDAGPAPTTTAAPPAKARSRTPTRSAR